MKTLKFILALLLLPLLAGAQAGMTLRTAKMIEEQKVATSSPLLRSVELAEQEVSALLSTSQALNIQDIRETGAKVGTVLDGVVTVRATPSQLGQIAQVKGVNFIAADNRAFPKLDKALPMVKVDSVHLGAGGLPQAYTGKDVIVGIVDFGFNYTHPTFYDSLGNLRIARVWDQADSKGSSCTYMYGSVYTSAEVMEQKISSSNESHGTHVAGIAAGGGGEVKTYGGVSPDANLVLVQLSQGTDAEIVDALSYIFSYAQSLGKPAVVNLSLGYHFGPHDGTSTMDEALDQLSGEGRIVVGAAGNEGNIRLHASHTFASEADTMRTIVGVTSMKEAYAMAWMDRNQQAQWNVEVWNKITKERLGSASTSFYLTQRGDEVKNKVFVYNRRDTIKVSAAAYSRYTNTNVRGVIDIEVYNGNPNGYSVVLAIKADAGSRVHLWHLGDAEGELAEFESLKLSSSWANGDTECTVGEIGGTAKSIISVGAYVSRSEWQAHSGEENWYGEEQNSMASFSSLGPTADGRMKPDLIAPGSALISSVNTCDKRFGYSTFFNSYSDLTIDKEPSGAFYYATMQGTSMAAPVVTGAVALLLQECPMLTPDSVRSILQRTAFRDAYIDSLSPNTRGAGMLDMLGALKASQGKECGTIAALPFNNECKVTPTSIASSLWEEAKNQLDFSVMPNPNAGVFSIKTEESDILTLNVYDLGGTLLYRSQVQAGSEISLQYLPQGVYLVQLSKDGRQGVKKMLIMR